MNAVIVRTSISRNTGQQISKEIIGFEEVDEDDYYHPLVEVFGKRFVNDYQSAFENIAIIPEKRKLSRAERENSPF